MTLASLQQYSKEASKSTQQKVVSPEVFGSLQVEEGPQTYVIVVGESANRNHMEVYGYPRHNTPFALSDDWIVFRDVTSPATHTIPALKQVLRFGAMEEDGVQPSIIDLFNAAGFKTFWLSNQTAPKGSGNILESLTARASDRSYINLSRKEGKSATYDGELVPYLEKALADPAPKKVVFLHLLGSHLTYALRYPRGTGVFPVDSQEGIHPRAWLDSKAVEQINHYDNSLAYTDKVLHEVVQTVKGVEGPSFVLYFSDHGQDVYDSRHMRGCSEKRPTKNMIEIPMLLWLSPEYRELNTLKAQFLERAVSKAYSTKTLSGTIAQLACISSDKLGLLHTLFRDKEDVDRTVHGHLYRDMPK